MANPKSVLQELVSKNNGSFPIYTTTQHDTGYVSKVEFEYDKIRYSDSSEVFPSKKRAESSCAEKALEKLNNATSERYITKTDKNIHIFIDYENYNDDAEIDIFKKNNPQIKVQKFTSNMHPRAPKADMTVNSNRRDATDIFICCKVAELYTKFPESIVFVVTSDKFASALSDIYNSCHHVINIKSCYEAINTF